MANTAKKHFNSFVNEFNGQVSTFNILQEEAAILLKEATTKEIEAYNQAMADMYEYIGYFDLEVA